VLGGTQSAELGGEAAENGAVTWGGRVIIDVHGGCGGFFERTERAGLVAKQIGHLASANSHDPGDELRLTRSPTGRVCAEDLKEAGLNDVFRPLLCPSAAQPQTDHVKEKQASMYEQGVQRVCVTGPSAHQSTVRTESGGCWRI
jgi:hypothetical protein